MSGTLRRGLLAGAVGTTAINLTTYLDMAVRGRPASGLPADVVEAGTRAAGLEVPGSGAERSHRSTALGALSGIAAGLGTGVVASAARSAGLRLSPVSGSVVTGVTAMAATDVPAGLLGVTDPRTWSAESWASDVVPHLVYGAATHATLRSMEKRSTGFRHMRRPSAGLLARSFTLGMASGARSSMGLVGAAFGARKRSRLAQAGAAAAAAAELVADKQPAMPSRLGASGLGPRFASAVAGATALADRQRTTVDLPLLFGAAGAAAGSFAGAAWRDAGVLPDWQAALVEDAVAVVLTAWSVR